MQRHSTITHAASFRPLPAGAFWSRTFHQISHGTNQVPDVDVMAENMMRLTLNNGVQMPTLGFGDFQTPPAETREAVEAALLKTCYRHNDTAAAYGNEREVGVAIHDSGLARDEVVIETKIWISDYGYDEPLHRFERSVAKLGVDPIDLLPPRKRTVGRGGIAGRRKAVTPARSLLRASAAARRVARSDARERGADTEPVPHDFNRQQ